MTKGCLMVTEITLALAALYLALFWLRCCVRLRRELYFPLPKGLSALVKSRHAHDRQSVFPNA